MSNFVDPSRRVFLDRNSFNFNDLDEVLEWVDFFKPSDALFAIEEFQRRTGLDFLQEYKKDFGREYQPPTDDVPMKQPVSEPSPDFKREVLYYWEELQYNPKQRKFMAYTTPEDIESWNKEFAPNAHVLSQMDSLDITTEVPQQPEDYNISANSCNNFPATTEPQRQQMVSVASAIAELNTGSSTITASRTVIDTLVHVAVPEVQDQVSEGNAADPLPETRTIVETYRRDLPSSPRKTRSSSKLDDVLKTRHPKTAPDLIDITNMDQSGRRRFAADKDFICLDYHGKMYAVKARDHPAALRRLTSFAT